MFSNISIQTRVVAAFGVVLALTLFLGVLSLTRMSSVADSGVTIGTNALPSIKEIEDIYTSALRTRVNQYQHILSTTEKEMDTLEGRMKGAQEEFENSRKNYEILISSKEERSIYDSAMSKWAEYMSNWKSVHTLSRQNKSDEANAIMRDQQTPLFYKFQEDINKLIKLNEDTAVNLVGDLQATTRMSLIITAVVLALATILALAAGWSLISGVVKPVRGMTDTMNRLARHELTVAVEGGDRGDEIGDMARAVQVF
ncbi:MCP four helix bundle domain-containing protein, partial [Agrobacterium sp.]|uniref:MCP four helix bundle domain-containing protein n=1 Tax=Agrobacterium sp. TaxID=361 RepID=UPI0040336514